jgi:ribosomal protein S18 acetylase RimI-like enzyme
MIRDTQASDMEAIMQIVKDSGQFDTDAVAHVRETLQSHLAGNGDGIWLTSDDGEPVAVAYCAPEPVASGAWNLLMLWTRVDRNRAGHGSSLVKHLELELHRRKARLLIVETSGLPDFAPARDFYTQFGFSHEATIRSFFAAGDDKLVFTRHLSPSPS